MHCLASSKNHCKSEGRDKKNATNHRSRATVRVGAGVGQSESPAPRAADHQPFFNMKVFTQSFHVVNQIRGGVGLQGILVKAETTTALVEQNGAHMLGMEQLAVSGPTTAARAAMQEHHGQAVRIAAFFKIHRVAVFFWQKPMLIRFYRRVKVVQSGVRHRH